MQEEQMIATIEANLFDAFWESYKDKEKYNKDFIKKVFLEVDKRYKGVISDSSINELLIKNISVYEIVKYIIAEHRFHLNLLQKHAQQKLEDDKTYFNQLVSICFDKLLTNEYYNVEAVNVVSKYSVETSLLMMYANRMLHLLKHCKVDFSNERQHLLYDIFIKCLLLLKATIDDLTNGLETESMSSWRTLHELMCVLCVIQKSDISVAKSYYRHLEYGAYSRGEIKDAKEIEKIEKLMQQDMEALEVKKANKEKFINYGWIHWAYKEYNGQEVKMNFLGGLQRVAELDEYKKYYEIASDVTHSTPLLVYANKQYLTTIILKVSYKSFFKLESMFIEFIKDDLKMQTSDKPFHDYLVFREMYKQKVELVYGFVSNMERKMFTK